MFKLFGRKREASPEEIAPELRRHIVRVHDNSGIDYVIIATATLNVGISLVVKERGIAEGIKLLRMCMDAEKDAFGCAVS